MPAIFSPNVVAENITITRRPKLTFFSFEAKSKSIEVIPSLLTIIF